MSRERGINGGVHNCVRNEKKGRKKNARAVESGGGGGGVWGSCRGFFFPIVLLFALGFLLLFLLLLLWKLPYLQAKILLLFFLCEISPRFTAQAVPLVSSKTNLPPKRSPHWTLLEVFKRQGILY
jgi:hypothetical protein